MKYLIVSALLLFFSHPSFCYALDWKKLHNDADKISVSQAEGLIAKPPNSINDLYLAGLVYLNSYKNKEAKDIFAGIIKLDDKAVEAKWGLAEVLRREHRLDESKKLLTELKNFNSQFFPSYISLAYIEYTQANFNNAIQLAEKVIRQGRANVDLSNFVRALLIYAGSKGIIAYFGGPLSKIINGVSVFPALKRAQKLQPDSAGVLFALGGFYLLAPAPAGGDIDKALIYLEKAIRKEPFFPDAYVRLAQVYQIKGDNKKYELYLNKALEIDPKNELALDIKMRICKFICVATKK